MNILFGYSNSYKNISGRILDHLSAKMIKLGRNWPNLEILYILGMCHALVRTAKNVGYCQKSVPPAHFLQECLRDADVLIPLESIYLWSGTGF